MNRSHEDSFQALLGSANSALRSAARSLTAALDGIPPVNEVAQLTYIKQQAESVASVAWDVNLLVEHGRFKNIVGLCRIGFESRIHVCAAMRVTEFAAQKYIAQTKGNVDEAEELLSVYPSSKQFQDAVLEQRALLAQMRNDFKEARERTWKISEAAEAAGLGRDYKDHYSLLSKAAHNTPMGLAAKDDPRILVSSVLRLVYDTIETCACLVFFRKDDKDSPTPLTRNWEHLIEQIATLQNDYAALSRKWEQSMNAALE